MTTLLFGQTVNGMRSAARRSDQRRVLHDRDTVVDALEAEHVEPDADVLGSGADRLAGMARAAEPVPSREIE